MSFSELLSKFLPIAEDEAGTVVNKSAKNLLQQEAARDAANTAALAAGKDAPLTQKLDLSGIDKSKLPQQTNPDTGFQLVGGPQDKGFTLGPSSDISRPPVPYKAPEVQVDPSKLPAISSKVGNSDVIDISPSGSRLKTLIPAIAAAGGVGAYIASQRGGDNTPSANAAAPDMQKIQMDPLTVHIEGNQAASGKGVASAAPTKSDDSEADAPKAPIDTDTSNVASTQKLADMQQQMRDQLRSNEIGRISAAMATGMSGQKNEFDPIFTDRAKRISQLPEQYNELVEFQKKDPNSAISKTFRDLASQYGMKVSPNASAEQLEKPIQELGRIKEMQARIAELHEYHQGRLENQQDAIAARHSATLEKDQKDYDKNFDGLMKTAPQQLDPQKMRKATGVGQLIGTMNAVDRLRAFIGGNLSIEELNKLPPQVVSDINLGLASLASQTGAPSELVVKKMDPDTLNMNLAKMKQWILSRPVPAGMGNSVQWANRIMDEQYNNAHAKVVKSQNLTLVPLMKAYFDPRTSDGQKMQLQALLNQAELPADTFDKMRDGALNNKAGTPVTQAAKQINAAHDTLQSANQSPASPGNKQIVKKQFSPSRNQTRIQYSDGTTEIVNGQQ